MGPRSPGHQTRGCSTGLSLENTTLETGAEREGIQRNTTTAGSGQELGSNSQPGLGVLGFYCLVGSHHPGYGHLGCLLWYFPWRNFTLCRQFSCWLFWSAQLGLKPTKLFLSPVFSSCLAWKNSELVREKQATAGFREQSWTSKGADKWA